MGFSQEGITSLILLINGSTKDWIFGGCNNAAPPPLAPSHQGEVYMWCLITRIPSPLMGEG